LPVAGAVLTKARILHCRCRRATVAVQPSWPAGGRCGPDPADAAPV